MGWDDLTADERAAVLRELRAIVNNDPFPLSPRIQILKAALDKLDPPAPRPDPLPPLEPPRERSMALRRNRRRR